MVCKACGKYYEARGASVVINLKLDYRLYLLFTEKIRFLFRCEYALCKLKGFKEKMNARKNLLNAKHYRGFSLCIRN